MVRKAIESLYKGRCTIVNFQEVFDEITKRTSLEEVVICENEPCRVSYSSVKSAETTETVTELAQVIKLFVRPELIINGGSKITVTQNGRTVVYHASGEVAVYTNHQEVSLTLKEGVA